MSCAHPVPRVPLTMGASGIEVLEQGAVVKVVGVQSSPQLNGTFVRLLRQLRNGRWETQGYSNPAQEAALRPENLMAMPPLTRQLFHYLSEESLAELYLEVSVRLRTASCMCATSCMCSTSCICDVCCAGGRLMLMSCRSCTSQRGYGCDASLSLSWASRRAGARSLRRFGRRCGLASLALRWPVVTHASVALGLRPPSPQRRLRRVPRKSKSAHPTLWCEGLTSRRSWCCASPHVRASCPAWSTCPDSPATYTCLPPRWARRPCRSCRWPTRDRLQTQCVSMNRVCMCMH